MAWFKRQSKGIQTPTEEKKDIPKGLWYKSPTGKIVDTEELQANFYVSPEDDYHVRIGSREYFSIIFESFGNFSFVSFVRKCFMKQLGSLRSFWSENRQNPSHPRDFSAV